MQCKLDELVWPGVRNTIMEVKADRSREGGIIGKHSDNGLFNVRSAYQLEIGVLEASMNASTTSRSLWLS